MEPCRGALIDYITVLWLKEQTKTQSANTQGTNKLLDNSSLTLLTLKTLNSELLAGYNPKVLC